MMIHTSRRCTTWALCMKLWTEATSRESIITSILMKEQRKRKTSFFEAGNRSSLFQIIPLMYQFSFIIPTIYNNINMPIGTTASAVYHESYFEQASGLFF